MLLNNNVLLCNYYTIFDLICMQVCAVIWPVSTVFLKINVWQNVNIKEKKTLYRNIILLI